MSDVRQELRALERAMDGHDGRPLTFMEVCGTHTMAIARTGLKSLLPGEVRLVSGPGCPVCVTPVAYLDHALALAERPEVVIATFGDLVRVPGSRRGPGPAPSLLRAKATGADVRVVYSALAALDLARSLPDRQVVFLAVGFETTAPTAAAAVLHARDEGVDNFSILGAHKTVPEAMWALASSEELGLDGFLCPGHASVVIGPEPYEPLARDLGLACAIGGFEAVEVIRAMASLLDQVVRGDPRVDNCYPGAVRPGGNSRARELMYRVLEPCDSVWRGLGTIPGSGLAVREELAALDAGRRFEVDLEPPVEPAGCRCGEVLRGLVHPSACPLFGRACTPESPVGACMVSSEGSCAAAYQYGEEVP